MTWDSNQQPLDTQSRVLTARRYRFYVSDGTILNPCLTHTGTAIISSIIYSLLVCYGLQTVQFEQLQDAKKKKKKYRCCNQAVPILLLKEAIKGRMTGSLKEGALIVTVIMIIITLHDCSAHFHVLRQSTDQQFYCKLDEVTESIG